MIAVDSGKAIDLAWGAEKTPLLAALRSGVRKNGL